MADAQAEPAALPLKVPVALNQDHVCNDLICSICMTLTAEPLLTPCDHMFCRTCIHQALGNQSICPIDRRPSTYGQLWRMDGLSLHIWSGIKVKCGCHDIGCAWRGVNCRLQCSFANCTARSSRNHQQGGTITTTLRWKKS